MAIGWIILLFVAIVLGWALQNALRRTGKSGKYRAVHHGAAVCGACGYPASPRDTDVCAECGQRYDHAGVLTRALAIRTGPPFALTVVAALFASLIVGVVASELAKRAYNAVVYGGASVGHIKNHQDYTPSGTVTVNATGAVPNYQLRVTHEGTTTGFSSTSMPFEGTITIELTNGGNGHTVVYDIEAQRWELRDANGATTQSGTDLAQGAEAFFIANALDTVWAGSQDELIDVRAIGANAVNSTAPIASQTPGTPYGLATNGGGSSYTSGGSFSNTSPVQAGVQLAAGLLPMAFSVVILVIAHRRRQRILAPEPA